LVKHLNEAKTKMALFNRSALMKAHVLIAAFILPVAIMFFCDWGALYLGYKR